MNRGFTITEFAAATLIGLPLLIVGIQIMPGLMKSSDTGNAEGITTMLLRNSWDKIRSEARTDDGFDVNYDQPSEPFSSPYTSYRLSIADTTTSNLKHLTLTVWYDKNSSGAYESNETSYSISGYLTRTQW